jgi:formylmethanofuran dehydrogenase subunit E
MLPTVARVLAAAIVLGMASPSRAETPEEWIALGTRVHGGFGSFIPVGIRIGLDVLQRLNPQPRGVTVVYFSGLNAPCPCPADGIAIATTSSAGQGTLRVEKVPDDVLGVALIRSKATGAGFRYTVPASWIPKLIEINKNQDPRGRYDAVINAPDLFTVEELPVADVSPR